MLSPSASSRPSFFRSFSSSSAQSLTSSISPRKNKPRLYLALYPRGGLSSSYASSITCDSYHWTLVVGSKSASRDSGGTCYQIVHSGHPISPGANCSSFFYEETDLSQQSQAQSRTLLVRITLAKVLDEDRLQCLLRSLPPSTPPSPDHSHTSDSEYDTEELDETSTCLAWVKAAFKTLAADSKCLRLWITPDDWLDIEECARIYVKKKRMQGRFGNLAGIPDWNEDQVPTWNFWENRETAI